MFNLQGSEIVIVLLLALVVLGPEKLPEAIRKVGQFYAELKKMSSGFQSEFRAAVDEPMREMRDTANILRDSADFTKLQDGERDEKPKSADMAPVPDLAPTPPDSPEPVESVAGTAGDGGADEPQLAADSKPSPFSGLSSTMPVQSPPPGDGGASSGSVDLTDGGTGEPATSAGSKPAPFSGRSSTAPRQAPAPVTGDPAAGDSAAGDSAADDAAADDESAASARLSDGDDATGHAP